MSRLPQKAPKDENENLNVDDDISMYCIVDQTSQPNTPFKVSETETRLLSTTKQLRAAQTDVVLGRKLKEVLVKDGTLAPSEDALLCRRAATGRTIQKIILYCYKWILRYHEYCSTLDGPSGTRTTYDVFWKGHCRLYVTSDVHDFPIKCESCRRRRPTQKHRRCLQIFLPGRALDFAARNILRPLTKRNQKKINSPSWWLTDTTN